MNIELAEKIISNLNTSGVSEFIVCAGARNAPFVKILGASDGARVRFFYDERAAGFYALGRTRQSGRPVAVITTSGTAAAELLPAAIEAYYSGVPLVLVTADRPQNFRGSGSPQTIEQVGLFSYYAQKTLDLSKPEDVPAEFTFHSTLHLNVCFSEPLLDRKITALQLRDANVSLSERSGAANNGEVSRFFSTVKKPLVLASALPASVRGRVLEFLSNLNAPIYAEAQSGLRECQRLLPLILKSGEAMLKPENILREFDGVLRIGSVPTVRLWRDLDLTLAKMPVLSVSDTEFSGLAREVKTAVTFSSLFSYSAVGAAPKHDGLTIDSQNYIKLGDLFARLPLAEPSLFRRLSRVIPPDDLIFVGNSLPIREWDFAADYAHPHENVFANRGANGIDGVISTFIGMSKTQCENWLVIGDLSALYDLNALSFAEPGKRLRIVVVNNNGGQIFTRMFNDSHFVNPHTLNFQKWAEMFGFEYVTSDLSEPLDLKSERVVIELKPDNSQSEKFWVSYTEVTRPEVTR
jgi:2-succinyl-5-enolpyruvyl-6-hydroxy-3-cyclohexene-1-carboxylate synthase